VQLGPDLRSVLAIIKMTVIHVGNVMLGHNYLRVRHHVVEVRWAALVVNLDDLRVVMGADHESDKLHRLSLIVFIVIDVLMESIEERGK
jgi:hypothetical protein